MHRQRYMVGIRILLSGIFVLALVASPYHAAADDTPPQVASVCQGFVVLSNGYAVLSGLRPSPMAGMQHDMQHATTHQAKAHKTGSQMAHAHQQMTHESHGHAGEMNKPSGAQQHLMGYQHGQDVTLQEGMLCVPVGHQDATTWTTVSRDPALSVRAESLKGALTHNSRANEAFALTIMQRGAGGSDELSTVRVRVRMPHHDRRMPGGHGLANDPDVQGLVAERDEEGRYRVPTVDFSMAGVWLVEVQVQQGGNTRRAYFAVDVGEE